MRPTAGFGGEFYKALVRSCRIATGQQNSPELGACRLDFLRQMRSAHAQIIVA
jgi:hypothetical protein